MNLLKRLFYFSIVLCTIISCKKKIPDIDYPGERYCEKFAGKYLMFDPDAGAHYEMECYCQFNADPQYDSIEFINFANKYDFKYQLFNLNPKDNGLEGTVIHPLYDYDSNRTSFSIAGYSINPPKNIFRNDSLYINFTTNNLAFYMEDGATWNVCVPCQHYGVKIH